MRFKSSSLPLTPAAANACLISSAPFTPCNSAALPEELFLKFSILYQFDCYELYQNLIFRNVQLIFSTLP
jgi:hypothetical protein